MTVARHFGKELTKSLPYLWESMTGPLRNALDAQGFGMSALTLFVTCFVSPVEFLIKMN